MGSALAPAAQHSRYRHHVPVGAALLLWLVPSLDYIQKYTGQIGLLVVPLIAVSAIVVLPAIAGRLGPNLAKWGIVVLCGAAIALFVVLYPIANSGLLGPGSDRDDALNVALQALLAGQYPYGVETYLGNPPTPMPGALILALPFFVLGNSALQNLVWLPVFARWCLHYFEEPTMAFIYLAIFIIGCPASLGDFVTGGDYLVNALYVAVAMAAVLWAQQGDKTWYRYAASVFLGVAISSRPIYAIAPVLLAGSVFQASGARRAMEFVAIVVLVCAVLNGPLFLYDPSRFPTPHLSEKLSGFPQFVHATIVLPALGMAIASLSFFVTMTGKRVFGLMALALGVMLYPVAVLDIAISSFDANSFSTASFSLPVTLFAGLWISEKFVADRRRRALPAAT